MTNKILTMLIAVLLAVALYIIHQIFPEINFGYIVAAWIADVSVALFVHLLTKDKPEPNKIQKIVTENLADKHKEIEDYTNHLKLDIFGVLKSKNSSFFDALSTEHVHKQMIIQHIYTHEGVGGTPLYRNYRQVWKIQNRAKNSGFDLMKIYYNMTNEISEISRSKKDFFLQEADMDYPKLLKVLGFQPNIEFHSDEFDVKEVKPVSTYHVNESHFYVMNEYGDKSKYYLKYDQTVIGKSESEKILKKILTIVIKHSSEMVNLVTIIQTDTRSIDSIKTAFNDMMIHVDGALEHGKPNFGVCDACVEVFPYQKKQLYNRYLIECKTSPYNYWGEGFW